MDKTFDLMHLAIDKLQKRLVKEKLSDQFTGCKLVRRWNKESGNHVHATAAIRLVVDESASENEREIEMATEIPAARNGNGHYVHV